MFDATGCVRERTGEISTASEAIGRVLGERYGKHRVEGREQRMDLRQYRRRGGQVAADHNRRVGVREQWRSGQQMVGGGR
ncbi:hypothetical protein NIIDMKKI_05060 [Mycobacterium kansasii]|uniref:Uncharacterized protein n=1 Tax=Mycobacterium kansasii TaxID=1768 RepID=A0A7G1I2P9_MYCKA|nr:hypothetical protein NIIDMKKI_05060 [Mycobacterium kansasii]